MERVIIRHAYSTASDTRQTFVSQARDVTVGAGRSRTVSCMNRYISRGMLLPLAPASAAMGVVSWYLAGQIRGQLRLESQS